MIDPVELQVLTGALRAICEEMGAVLIRSAHSANIKERRDASTALFDPRGEMVMQAEHIPVHLGAMPAAVRGDPGRGPRPRSALDPQRPLPRRHPPPRHHGDHAGVRRRRAGRVRGQPRAPRRRRRAHSRLDAGRQPDARRRGGGDRAAGARRARDRRAERADAPARAAARRPAGAARHGPGRERAGSGSSTTASARASCARPSPRCSTTPSGERGPAWATLPDGRRRARDVLEAREGDLEIVLRGERRGRPGDARLLRHRAAARGQPQLPAGSDPIGVLLRDPRPDRPRDPAERGRLPAGRGDRARGMPAQRAAPGRRGRRQRRDLVAGRRRGAAGVRTRARPGDDEQRHDRQRARSPTTRRSPAGRAPAPTRTARAPCTWR